MKIETKIRFDKDEIADLCKTEYLRLMGAVPEGYTLESTDYYGRGWDVFLVEKEKPAPPPEPQPDTDVLL